MTITHNRHTEEKWENRELGASEDYVRKVSAEREQAIDDALDLQVISVRLQKELIKNLKLIAKDEGLGYQTLLRQVLTNFARNRLSNDGRLLRAAR